jgi:hypothetical protein
MNSLRLNEKAFQENPSSRAKTNWGLKIGLSSFYLIRRKVLNN